MSVITLGLIGLYTATAMTILAAGTLAVTRYQIAKERKLRLEEPLIDWQGLFVGPERVALAPRPPAPLQGIPAPLEPYVDYGRAKELHTAPIDYARAMRAAGILPEEVRRESVAA